MRTKDVIRALVADQSAPFVSIERRCAALILPVFLLTAVLFVLGMGTRADLLAVAAAPRFLFKFLVTLSLAVTALLLLCRLARPGAGNRALAILLLTAPAFLAMGVATELAITPVSAWHAKLVGNNSLICLSVVPLLSAPILAATLLAMRHGAPTAPTITGAVAGLLAGGLGAAIYALACTDDSPLFVATWYSITIVLVAAIGAIAGARLLRW